MTPPAVRAAGSESLDLAAFPAGTERVELAAANGERLRGVFVPAEPGAPVVLHLLESGGSITEGAEDRPVLWDLRAHGFAQLCVDYRGVGASGGERSPWNMPDDARVAWEEAVRRAGGDPTRVVLRGSSLGGFAIASLLESGATPGAIVLASPVREKTAVRNFAIEWGDGWERTLAPILFRRPSRTDLVRSLRDATAATLVIVGGDDSYLRADERELFKAALDRKNGRFVERADDDHNSVVDHMTREIAEERELYARVFTDIPDIRARLAAVLTQVPDAGQRFVEGSAARARLEMMLGLVLFDEPKMTAACALSWDPNMLAEQRSALEWMRGLDAGIPLDALAALVSFTDPMGPMNMTDFFGWRAWAHVHGAVPLRGMPEPRVREWPVADRDKGKMPERFFGKARLELPEREMLRQGYLHALKAVGVPARPVRVGDRWQVEVWQPNPGWRRVSMDTP
jgi:pimeloyl-ACP methyl ester carboxylesterase